MTSGAKFVIFFPFHDLIFAVIKGGQSNPQLSPPSPCLPQIGISHLKLIILTGLTRWSLPYQLLFPRWRELLFYNPILFGK